MEAGPKLIVYVEDNATNLDLVTRVLESTGRYRVVGAADGIEGLRLIRAERPALILVDLDVPEVNGFEIARRMKADPDPALRAIPIVAISANVLKNERTAALEAGCCAFVEKPFDLAEFRREVDRAIASA